MTWSWLIRHGITITEVLGRKVLRSNEGRQLLAFPMREVMHNKSVLFLWATSPRLDFAIHCLAEWGLCYRGVAFVWVKTRLDGTPVGSQGVRPSIIKPVTDYVLAASIVEKGRPMPLSDEGVCQTIFEPRTQHSCKPDEVMRRIERLYPTASRIELFARRRTPGWDSWVTNFRLTNNVGWVYDKRPNRTDKRRQAFPVTLREIRRNKQK